MYNEFFILTFSHLTKNGFQSVEVRVKMQNLNLTTVQLGTHMAVNGQGSHSLIGGQPRNLCESKGIASRIRRGFRSLRYKSAENFTHQTMIPSYPAEVERGFPHVGSWPCPHALQPDATGGGCRAQVVFDACWRKLEGERSSPLQAPAEVVWLNGAPGSGKGANTPFIMESRGITRAITMWAPPLLSSPDFEIWVRACSGRRPVA